MGHYSWRMHPTPAADPTSSDSWSLAAQWAGSSVAVAAVLVAVLFCYLTLASSRRSKDVQQRATIVAALDDPYQPQSILGEGDAGHADSTIRHKAGKAWLLVNEGPGVA